MVFEGIFGKRSKEYVPPPEPRPEYDPAKEAPMWNWARLWWGNPLEEDVKRYTQVGEQPATPNDPDWRGVVENEVNAMVRPEPYKLGMPIQDHYFWFDTPDYADPFKKLGYAFKFLGCSSLITACFLGILGQRRLHLKDISYLYKEMFGAYIAAGMAGSTAVVTVANLRGRKDDYWNYVAGMLTYACVMGHSSPQCFVRSAVFGSLFVLAKHNAEINGNLYNTTTWVRQRNWGIGMDANHGFWSGEFRPFTTSYGDSGRDRRRMI